jgi:hypothetical protein
LPVPPEQVRRVGIIAIEAVVDQAFRMIALYLLLQFGNMLKRDDSGFAAAFL